MTDMSLNLPQELYDVIIIGGGPAGLSAAMYAARATLSTIVLDKSPTAGALAAADAIENYPGVEKMTGAKLLSLFREQAEKFGAKIVKAQVVGVNFSNEVREVITADKTYSGKTIIIATGSMGRTPSIKGEKEFLGRGVSYCAVCDAPFFTGKDVAVIGEVEEIIEEITPIAKFSSHIYVFPRKKLTPEHFKTLTHPKIEVLSDYKITQILGDNTVKSVVAVDSHDRERTFDVSGVFIYLRGSKPIVDFLYGVVEVTQDGCIKTNPEDKSTSLEGVFAVGDVTCKKFRQVIIAAAEGCTAALAADKYLSKKKAQAI